MATVQNFQNQNRSVNHAQMKDKDGNILMARHSHTPVTFEHQGIQCQIKANGRVLITSRPIPIPGSEDVEYDSVEVPASVIFKIREKLNETRKTDYVRVVSVPEDEIVREETATE